MEIIGAIGVAIGVADWVQDHRENRAFPRREICWRAVDCCVEKYQRRTSFAHSRDNPLLRVNLLRPLHLGLDDRFINSPYGIRSRMIIEEHFMRRNLPIFGQMRTGDETDWPVKLVHIIKVNVDVEGQRSSDTVINVVIATRHLKAVPCY